MSEVSLDVSAKLAAPYRHPSTAIVVALLQNNRITCNIYGNANVEQACLPGDVLFEIGSITKVFTALLLARLAEDGLIDPDRPIGSICKPFAGAPDWITPKRLATHSSGLPRLHIPVWKALLHGVGDDPYAAFARDDLIRWLQDWRPSRPPPANAHAYSNLGFGLLGEVLAISQGQDYESLLSEKIITPMGLKDTAITPTEAQRRRFAPPHAASGKRVAPWTFRALAGAGALRATAGDLARLASRVVLALAEPATPLDRAIVRSVEPLVGLSPGGAMVPMAQCLGWISMTPRPTDMRILLHEGGTAGSTSALHVCPQKKAAIVVLANRGVAAGAWSNLKLILSNPRAIALNHFAAL